MKVNSEYAGYPVAAFGRRFGGFILDVLITLVVGIIFTVVSANILPNIPAYKEAVTNGNNALTTCYDIIDASHLRKTIAGTSQSSRTLVELSTTFKEYITYHIEGTNNTENDNIEYYYLTYRRNNNFGDASQYTQKYINVTIRGLNEDPSKNTSSIWTYNDINEIPRLTDNYKTLLKEYFDGATSSDHQNAYNNTFDEYSSIVNDKGLAELTTAEYSPYTEHFKVYEVSIRTYYQIWAVDILLCYFIAVALTYIPFAFVFKDANSIGKKAMKLVVMEDEKYRASWWKRLLRILCTFFAIMFISILMVMFIDLNILAVPLFYIGSLAITPVVFSIISTVLALISLGLFMFRKDKKSLHDLMLNTNVYDIRFLPADLNATPNDQIDQFDPNLMAAARLSEDNNVIEGETVEHEETPVVEENETKEIASEETPTKVEEDASLNNVEETNEKK